MYHGHSKQKTTVPAWPQPIELDATTRKQPSKLSQKERERRRAKKLCFQCRSNSHLSNFHRKGKEGQSKNKRLQQKTHQINMIGHARYNISELAQICLMLGYENPNYNQDWELGS